MTRHPIFHLAALLLVAGLSIPSALHACEGRGREDRRPKPVSILEFQEELDLTQDQVSRIQSIEEAAKSQVEPLKEQLRAKARELRSGDDFQRGDLRSDPTVTAIRDEIRSVMQSLRQDIHSVLTEEQLTQLKELHRAKRLERDGERHGGREGGFGRRNAPGSGLDGI